MEDEIREMVESILGTAAVSRGDRLAEDLEAESIDVVNLIAAVEERYEIVLGHEEIARVHTVGDLCDVVAAAAGDGPTG